MKTTQIHKKVQGYTNAYLESTSKLPDIYKKNSRKSVVKSTEKVMGIFEKITRKVLGK